jgi:hypothetical protein
MGSGLGDWVPVFRSALCSMLWGDANKRIVWIPVGHLHPTERETARRLRDLIEYTAQRTICTVSLSIHLNSSAGSEEMMPQTQESCFLDGGPSVTRQDFAWYGEHVWFPVLTISVAKYVPFFDENPPK